VPAPSTPSARPRPARAAETPPGLPEDALVVAVVGRAHGVGGELRLVPTSGDPERLLGLTRVWIPTDDEPQPRPRRVLGVRIHAGSALARLEGIGSREDAARLTRSDVWASASELPAWGPDGFGLVDVVGAELFDGETRVGRVVDVVSNAGRDHFEVDHDGRRGLVPAVRDWLVQMDLPGKRIVMRLPEGLVD